jgi:hypothetical protein
MLFQDAHKQLNVTRRLIDKLEQHKASNAPVSVFSPTFGTPRRDLPIVISTSKRSKAEQARLSDLLKLAEETNNSEHEQILLDTVLELSLFVQQDISNVLREVFHVDDL